MNRADLQTLARERIEDAEALVRGGRWSFAYYTIGYAVECALKSCLLARMIETGWVFQENAKISQCLTHDFTELIRLAGMKSLLEGRRAESLVGDRKFHENWEMVIRWEVTDRYEEKSEAEALGLRDAIIDPTDGVFSWISTHW